MIGTGVDILSLLAETGVKEMKIIPDTAYTLTNDDSAKFLLFTSAANCKLSVPAGLTGLFFQGAQISTGQVKTDPATNAPVQIRTFAGVESKTTEQNCLFTLTRIGDNDYIYCKADGINYKPNKSANTEYELLADTSEKYGLALFSRLGGYYRSPNLSWDDTLKKLTIKGTQAIWEAFQDVTDGNMGIKALEAAVESFKLFDSMGNFISTGTTAGKRVTRVFTKFRLVNGTAFNEAEYKAVECPVSVTTLIKAIDIPANSVVTIDVYNISVMNMNKKVITGFAQFAILNDGTTVTGINPDDLKFGRQYSTIKTTPGYVTNTDTRIDAAISGATANINFVNTVASVANVHCEIKFTVTLIPEA